MNDVTRNTTVVQSRPPSVSHVILHHCSDWSDECVASSQTLSVTLAIDRPLHSLLAVMTSDN